MAALVTERSVKEKIRDRIKKYAPLVKAIPYPQGIGGEPGTPDRIGCVNGRMFLIEVKRPEIRDLNGKLLQSGGALSPLQRKRLEEWAAVGAATLVTSNPDDVEPFIEGLIQRSDKPTNN